MKKTFIPLLAIILVVAGYFGYQHYQTQQYIEKVMPLYRSMETLQGDQEKVFKEGGGKLYKDLIAECDRVKTASKDLKLRVAEVSPTTARASEIRPPPSPEAAIDIGAADDAQDLGYILEIHSTLPYLLAGIVSVAPCFSHPNLHLASLYKQPLSRLCELP